MIFHDHDSQLLVFMTKRDRMHMSMAPQERSLTVAEKLADVAVERGDPIGAVPAVKGKKKTETSTAQSFFWTKDTSKGGDLDLEWLMDLASTC